MVNLFFYDTKIGRLTIAEEAGKIIAVNYGNDKMVIDYCENETDIIKKTADEIYRYLDGSLQKFTVPINPKGTEFMHAVWNKLLNIKYGTVATYKDIAIAIKNPKAVRAVGLANNKNPIAIIIPCHRVIGSNGKLVGYAGGLDIKKTLLEIEGTTINRTRQ